MASDEEEVAYVGIIELEMTNNPARKDALSSTRFCMEQKKLGFSIRTCITPSLESWV